MYLASQPAAVRRLSLMALERTRPRRRTTIGNYPGMAAWSALGFMDAITAADATEQVFPQSAVAHSAPGTRQPLRDQVLASAAAGQILNAAGALDYVPGTRDCASSGVSTNVRLAQISGQMALTGVNIAAIASKGILAALGGATVLGAATLGIGTIIGLLPLFLGHHAAAVAKERNVLCTVIPATNNYLQVIDQAVASGQATPQHAIAALDSLVNDFRAKVASIIHGSDPMSAGQCNAACAELTKLRAIVLQKQSVYQDLADQQAAPTALPATATTPIGTAANAVSSAFAPVTNIVSAGVAQATRTTGIPSWVLYAAGGWLLSKWLL